ncbi:hypothetical protein D3C87_1241170 [compost metagenome]
MQDIGGVAFEPLDVLGPAKARDDAEARLHLGMETGDVIALGQQVLLPEQRQVVEDRIVCRERHVVRQARPGQRHRRQMLQLIVRSDDAVMHVGRGLGIVEEQQLAGLFIDLGVGRDSLRRTPGVGPQRRQRIGVQAIGFAALIEGREDGARVNDDVGRGGILQPAMRAPARLFRQRRMLGQTGPQGAPRRLFGDEALGADKAVAIGGLAVREADSVDHAVAVERVIAAERLLDRVFGVAHIDAVDVGRNLADHDHVLGRMFGMLRRPGAGHIGVVGGLQRDLELGRTGVGQKISARGAGAFETHEILLTLGGRSHSGLPMNTIVAAVGETF